MEGNCGSQEGAVAKFMIGGLQEYSTELAFAL